MLPSACGVSVFCSAARLALPLLLRADVLGEPWVPASAGSASALLDSSSISRAALGRGRLGVGSFLFSFCLLAWRCIAEPGRLRGRMRSSCRMVRDGAAEPPASSGALPAPVALASGVAPEACCVAEAASAGSC